MSNKMGGYEQIGREPTYEVDTREPGRLVQLIRNACRDLAFETVQDTVNVSKENPREFGEIDGEIVLEGTHESEYRTRERKFLDGVTAVFGVVGVIAVVGGALNQSPAAVTGGLVATGLAGLIWLTIKDRWEQISYDHQIKVTLHGEVTADEQPTELADGGTAVPRSTRFDMTIDLTALSPHPRMSEETINDTLDRLDRRLTEVINV